MIDTLARIAALTGLVAPPGRGGGGVAGPQGERGPAGKPGSVGPPGADGTAGMLFGGTWANDAWPVGERGLVPVWGTTSDGSGALIASRALRQPQTFRSVVVSFQTTHYVIAGAPGTVGAMAFSVWSDALPFTGLPAFTRTAIIPNALPLGVDGRLAEAYVLPLSLPLDVGAGSIIVATIALGEPDDPATVWVQAELRPELQPLATVFRPVIPAA